MTDWTQGYTAEISYTYGYYAELNPLHARLAFLCAGLVPPAQGTACELGFGQGMTINIHAAASATEWWGTDFNPAQVGFAQEVASHAGSGARLFDEAFHEFCARDDLPEFDSIALHGIWSWISDDNRSVIVDFLRRKLKVGGVAYISYNTMPGWAGFAPLRHLMSQHASVMGINGEGILQKAASALAFSEQMLGTQPLYARANPTVANRLQGVKAKNREYVSHEYFNAHWDPMYVADMARWLAPAKLGFACSAHLIEHIDALNLTQPQQAMLTSIPDPMLRQTVRDYMVNQQFRKDYWVKGARQLSTIERNAELRALRVVLVTPRSKVSLKAKGSLGEVNLSETVYKPILDALADNQPHTVAEVEKVTAGNGLSFSQLIQVVLILAGSGYLAAAQDPEQASALQSQTSALNLHLMERARGHRDMAYLASPVTGGGVSVPRISQLFALASTRGLTSPEEWARFAWETLAEQGESLVIEGKPLNGTQENMAELTSQARAFAALQLPLLKSLGVL